MWTRSTRTLAGFCLMASLVWGQAAPAITPEARAFIEIHFLAAKRAESAGNFDNAIDEYQQILKEYPKLVPAVYQNLGLVYYLAHKFDAAIDTFNKGLQLDPTMVGAQLFLGDAYLETEQPEKAIPHLQYAHKAKPAAESAIGLGLAYTSLRKYDKAAQYFRFGLDGSPQKDQQLYFLGESYLKLAEKTANSLADQNPNSKYDHLLAAKVMDSQDRYQIAAKEYLEAGKKDPSHAAIFFDLARLLAILGLENPSALAMERYHQLMAANQQASLDASKLPKGQAADVGPKTDYVSELKALPPIDPARLPPLPLVNSDVNAELRKRLTADRSGKWKAGTQDYLNARWREAIADFQALPATDWLRDFFLAAAHLRAEEYDKAEEIVDSPAIKAHSAPAVQMLRWEVVQQLSFFFLNRLLEEFPQSARAHYVRARTLDAQSKKEAEEEYLAAITADPSESEPRIALADFYLSNSKYEEALAQCQKVLENNRFVSAANLRIGRIYIQLRDPQKGLPYVQDALKLDPDDAQARADLARAYELLGTVDKAVEEYQRALKLDPSLNRIHYVLGRIYRKQGKTELADAEFRVFEQNEASERTKSLVGAKQLPENDAPPPAK